MEAEGEPMGTNGDPMESQWGTHETAKWTPWKPEGPCGNQRGYNGNRTEPFGIRHWASQQSEGRSTE